MSRQLALRGELGALLGLARQTGERLSRRPYFPEPCAYTVAGRPLWAPADVKRWNQRRKEAAPPKIGSR